MTQSERWKAPALQFLSMIQVAPEHTYRWADVTARFSRHCEALIAQWTGYLLVSRELPAPSYLYECKGRICRIDNVIPEADGKATASVTDIVSGQTVKRIQGLAETVGAGTLTAYQRSHFGLDDEIVVPPFQATRAEIAAAAIEVLVLFGESVVDDVDHQTAAMFAAIAPN